MQLQYNQGIKHYIRLLTIPVLVSILVITLWFLNRVETAVNGATITPTVLCPTEILPTQYYSGEWKRVCKSCLPNPTQPYQSKITQFPTKDYQSTSQARMTITPGQTQVPTLEITPTPNVTVTVVSSSTPTPSATQAVHYYHKNDPVTYSGSYISDGVAGTTSQQIISIPAKNMCASGDSLKGEIWTAVMNRVVRDPGPGFTYRNFHANGFSTPNWWGNNSDPGAQWDIAARYTEADNYINQIHPSTIYFKYPGGSVGQAQNWGFDGARKNDYTLILTGVQICYGNENYPAPTPTPTVSPCLQFNPVSQAVGMSVSHQWDSTFKPWLLQTVGESQGVLSFTITPNQDVKLDMTVNRQAVTSIKFIGELHGSWDYKVFDTQGNYMYAGETLVGDFTDYEVEIGGLYGNRVGSVSLFRAAGGSVTSSMALDAVVTNGCPDDGGSDWGSPGGIVCSQPVLVDPNPPKLVSIGNVKLPPQTCSDFIPAFNISTGWIKSLASGQTWAAQIPDPFGVAGVVMCKRIIQLPILSLIGINIPIDAILSLMGFFLIIKGVLGKLGMGGG